MCTGSTAPALTGTRLSFLSRAVGVLRKIVSYGRTSSVSWWLNDRERRVIMRKSLGVILLVGIGFVMGGVGVRAMNNMPKKYAFILQAGTESHEGMARALHAMLYATELKKKGHDVVLIFDGAGTEWAEALSRPDNKLHPVYQKLMDSGVVEVVCDFCSTAFKVKDALAKEGAHFEGEYQGHPSIAKWVDQGYQLVVL